MSETITNRKKKILFIVQYPENVSPGQRFRFELYKDLLWNNGFTVTTHSFLGKKGHSRIYQKGHLLPKLTAVLKGYARRLWLILTVKKYDYILLQREMAPFGPPILEWIFIKVFKCKVIYDFDDAIWIGQASEHNGFILAFRNLGKVKKICRWAYKVSCGNDYLCNYAKQYSNHVVYNPTCVDTEKRHNIMTRHDVARVTIGWTGTFSTLGYMELVIPVLEKLQLKYDFDVKVICNKKPDFNIKNLQYVEWTEDSEVQELASCQIGLMPLTDDEWSEGKCGFKLIQYLSLGIPAVSSPVGVNKKIIEQGKNGFLCTSDEEWYSSIEKLILDAELRKKIGSEGRKKIVKEYSLLSNKENFLRLFS